MPGHSAIAADVISEATRAHLPELAAQFQRREPFRHVVIDDFFEPGFAQSLLQSFPGFDAQFALNEMGVVGGKAVREHVRTLPEPYPQLDAWLQTPDFLGSVSTITGIPDLLYDADYIGGGTHENVDGQGLDMHIDFNYHPGNRSHRRLNLIVYLNPEWEAAWGGCIELAEDPWNPHNRNKTAVLPLFNRAVIFETTEWSWHGFSRIGLPDAKRHLSRKSIALYFYTQERPPEELADTHSTIYVDRPLPERFVEGRTLDAHDVQALKVLLKRRDMHIQRLYRDIQHVQAQFEHLQRQVGLIRGSRVYRALVFLRRLIRGG